MVLLHGRLLVVVRPRGADHVDQKGPQPHQGPDRGLQRRRRPGRRRRAPVHRQVHGHLRPALRLPALPVGHGARRVCDLGRAQLHRVRSVPLLHRVVAGRGHPVHPVDDQHVQR